MDDQLERDVLESIRFYKDDDRALRILKLYGETREIKALKDAFNKEHNVNFK